MEAESQTLTQNAQLQNDLLQQIVELNEKVQDQENIIYSLEHTLSVYEKEKKQFFDEKMGFESVLIELQLENESKDRTIKRQNEEIDKLMTDLRHAKNEFEAFKNTNLSSKLLYNANDDIKQNTDNDAPVLVDEEPISIANETDSNNRTRSPSNVLEEFTKSIKINLFSPKAKGESHAVQLGVMRAKHDKLQQLNIVLEKSVNIQREELNILKQTNVDIITQITMKHKEINHLGECLEDNQLGFTRYKEESEQKLYQWKAEKKYWFDAYKKTREANEQLKQQKRKLENLWFDEPRKSNETPKGPDRAEPSIICSSGIDMSTNVADISVFVTEHKPDDVLVRSDGQCSNVQHCPQALRLIHMLNDHTKHSHIIDLEFIERVQIVSDYLHVIDQHNTVDEFEWIVSQCVDCNIKKCRIYIRKQCSFVSLSSSHQAIAFEEILDGLHCRFRHCFDTEYRLTSAETTCLRTDKEYNESQFECRQVNEDTNSLGMVSRHDFDGKYQCTLDSASMQCNRRYSSLKEELLHNNITMIQFRIQSEKARIYHAAKRKIAFHTLINIPIECVLALIMYCNCDSLQNEFNLKRRHAHVYHLGKLLEESVQKYGQIIRCTQQEKLYVNPSLFESVEVYINPYASLLDSSTTACYFGFDSVEWISDFCYEPEYLFIQGPNLRFVDINITQNTHMHDMRILNAVESILTVDGAVDSYTKTFANSNCFLVGNVCKREAHILHQRSVVEIEWFLFEYLRENVYFWDDGGTIEKEQHESKSLTRQQVDVFIRHFSNLHCQWLDMKMITQSFPIIESLYVECISLSPFILEDVLQHLHTNNHCIWRVVLQDIERTTSNNAILECLSKYKQAFKQIGFDIRHTKQNDIDSIVIEKQSDRAVMSGITTILNDTLEDTRLFHDTPISQHLKNNAVSCMISPSHAQGNNSGQASNSQQESTKESTDNNGTNESSNNHSNNGHSGGGSGGSGRGNDDNGNNDDKKDEKDKKDETDETDEEEEISNKKKKTQNVSKESDKQSHQPQQIQTQMLPIVHFTQIEATTAHVMRNTETLRANQQRLDGNDQRNLMSAPLSFCNTQTVPMPLYSTPSCIQSTACSHNTPSQPNLQYSEQKSDASHPPPSRNLPNGKPKAPNEFIKYKAQPHGMIRHPFIDKNGKDQRFRATSYSFKPSVSIGSRRGSRLVDQIMQKEVQETFASASDIFEYMNITIAMQFNDSMSEHDSVAIRTKVINCNFHATVDNEPLYCIIERHGSVKWKMEDALFTKTDVFSEYGFKSLPIASRLQPSFQREFQQEKWIRDSMQQTKQRKRLINCTVWSKVLVYSRPNIKKTQRNIHQITKNRFVKHLQYNVFNDSDLVPMIMFYHDMHRVEYVWIVTITGNHCKINVGISMIYKMDLRQVEVTGIHVDKKDIIKQHRWVPILSQNTMAIPPCLRTFASCDHIAIGNPDTAINHIKNVLAENRRLLERIQELEQQLQNERNLESAMNTSIPSETTVSSISSTN